MISSTRVGGLSGTRALFPAADARFPSACFNDAQVSSPQLLVLLLVSYIELIVSEREKNALSARKQVYVEILICWREMV